MTTWMDEKQEEIWGLEREMKVLEAYCDELNKILKKERAKNRKLRQENKELREASKRGAVMDYIHGVHPVNGEKPNNIKPTYYSNKNE